LLEHRAIVNLSAFYIDWTNIQITVQSAGATFLGNGGNATSKGFELETMFIPVEGLRLGFNAAYTDAHLTSLLPSAAINGYIIGYQLPNVPKWSGSFTADYSWPIGNEWKGDVGGGIRYTGKKYTGVVSTGLPNFQLDDYAAIDLNAGISNDRWSVRLFARNVTNKYAFNNAGLNTDIFNSPVNITGVPLQPRTIGIGVDVNF
jgi:iron complex outermembrane receptor protein